MEKNQELKRETWRPVAIAASVCAGLGMSGALASKWGLIFTLLFSIIAIILGTKARKNAKSAGEKSDYATISLVIGIIFTVVNAIKIIFWLVVLFAFTSAFGHWL